MNSEYLLAQAGFFIGKNNNYAALELINSFLTDYNERKVFNFMVGTGRNSDESDFEDSFKVWKKYKSESLAIGK